MSYKPNLPDALLTRERTGLADQLLSSAAYGAVVTLYILCANSMLSSRSKRNKHFWGLLVYMTVLVLLGTVFYITDFVTTIQQYIDNREYPGGPTMYYRKILATSPTAVSGNAAFCIEVWLSDALMIYRCLVVYAASQISFLVAIVPILLWLGSFVTGTLLLVQSSESGRNLWNTTNFAVPFFSLSIALNILVPLLIVTRLLYFRKQIHQAVGIEHARQYVTISAMIIESAALTACVSLLFVVPFGLGSAVSTAFQGSVTQLQIVSSLMITLRVANGRAWSKAIAKATYPHISSIKFATGPAPQSTKQTTRHDEEHQGNFVSRAVEDRPATIDIVNEQLFPINVSSVEASKEELVA